MLRRIKKHSLKSSTSTTSSALSRPLIYGLLLILVIISALPTLRLLSQALIDLSWGGDSSSSLAKILSDSNTWKALWHSIYTSFMAMCVSLLLGAGLAFFISLTDIRAKALWVFMFMLPMMIPPQVMALSWLQLMGPNSVLLKSIGMAPPLGSKQPLYSAWGIILLMGVQHAPLVFLTLRANLLNLPKELIEAARLSGASQYKVVRDMILPLCKNGLWAAAAIAFLSALGNFGIPAMLGIPVSYYVLPTLIYQKMADFGPTMINEVSSLSLLIAVLAVAVVSIQQHFQKRMALTGLPGRPLAFNLGPWKIVSEVTMIVILMAILVVPMLALLASSLVPAQGIALTWNNLTLSSYEQIVMSQSITWRAFKNSFILASSAALIIVLLSLPMVYWFNRDNSRLVTLSKVLMDIPYALPGVVLSIACILLFVKPIPLIQLSLYGTLWIILFAYISRFFAVGFKPVISSMMQIDTSLEESAQLCGASLAQRMRDIIIPLLAPAVFAGFILVFLIAFNELTVSALLWSAGNETIGVLIFNLQESGDVVMAAAVSVVVVALVASLMFSLTLLSKRLPQGVIPWQN
ncbi:MAG: iron ABC transporter permease [Alcaligenaceae bacterium]|nr:iron ABC transporter permease [Alcaligenaceae bacterium]